MIKRKKNTCDFCDFCDNESFAVAGDIVHKNGEKNGENVILCYECLKIAKFLKEFEITDDEEDE